MNFKSQICTTREQSERLFALGLKPETADMVYHFTKSKSEWLQWKLQPKTPTLRGEFWTPQRIAKLASPFHKHTDGSRMTGEEVFDDIWGKDIPAWSLAHLLEMMPQYIDKKEQIILIVEPPLICYYDTAFKGQYHFTTQIDIFHNCVDMIAWLVKKGHFNQNYLIDSGKEAKL